MCRPREGALWGFGLPRLQSAGSSSRHTAIQAEPGGGWEGADRGDRGAGQSVRQVRLTQDHGPSEASRLAIEPQAVERIWRREGLKAPVKQPKRRRLWFNDGSCVRLRPAWKDHVWAYDFNQLRLHDGKGVRLLTVIDEDGRACLAIRAARSIRSADVIEALAELMVFRGVPDHIRSDNGPEFTARAVREWFGRVGARTLYIEPGSPWENGLRVSTGS